MIDITAIIEAVFALIWALISVFLIPTIKARLSEQKRAELLKWAEIAVAAAEQLYDSVQGPAKKEYVLDFLRGKGYEVDAEEIENAIEAAVLKLHHELYGIYNNPAHPPEDEV